MNTKAQLQWWIEFSQKDLTRIKQKTRDKLEKELWKKMDEYCSFWDALSSDYWTKDDDRGKLIFEQQKFLLDHQKAAEIFVQDLKRVLVEEIEEIEEPEPFMKMFSMASEAIDKVEVKFTSNLLLYREGKFNSSVTVETDPKQLVYFFMTMLMNDTKIEDYKYCKYCGKLFLQVSREKRFCTRNCAANSAKR